MVTANLDGVEVTVPCSDGFRRRLILGDDYATLVALLKRLNVDSVGDIRLDDRVTKRVVLKEGIPYHLVAGLVQRYQEERGRKVGWRNGKVFTYGESEAYFVYETATQIVVMK